MKKKKLNLLVIRIQWSICNRDIIMILFVVPRPIISRRPARRLRREAALERHILPLTCVLNVFRCRQCSTYNHKKKTQCISKQSKLFFRLNCFMKLKIGST